MRGLLYNGLVLSDTQQRRDADCGPKRTKNKRVTIIGHTGNVGYTDSEYIVKDGDTIDKILEEFKVTKEELSNYNDISNIKANDKLIIPTNNE